MTRLFFAGLLTMIGLCAAPSSLFAQCFNNYSISPGGYVCGPSATITLSGSQVGVTYQLQLDGSNIGSPRSGTGSSLSMGTINSSGQCNVIATQSGSSCSAQVVGNAQIYLVSSPAGTVTASSTTVCSSNPVTFTATPTVAGTYSYQWFLNGPPISGATSQTYTTTSTGNYKVLITNSCGSIMLTCPTLTDGLVVGQPGPVSGAATLQQPVASSSYSVTAAANATGYTWSLSNSSAGTIQGSGNTITINWNSAFSGTVNVNATANGYCGTNAATPLTITVYPQLAAGTATPATQNINYNTAPGQLSVSGTTGGNGSYIYQWQNSPDNMTWTNISGAATISFTPTALTATTYYRRTVISNGISQNSSIATVTVYPQLAAGIISPGTQSINYNTPATLTGAAATGGNSSYAYQWQSSPDNVTFTNISGATGVSYTSGNLTTTTYFRRVVTSNTVTVNSVTATVTVYPQLAGGTISPGTQSINYNTPATLTGAAATGGNGSYAYQWQNSLDNVTFTNISGATGVSYTSGNLTATTYFRRAVISNTVTVNSATATVSVYPQLAAGAISPGTQSINYNTPAALTGAAATGGNGSYAYQWQSSPDNVTFTNISGATGASYTSGNLTVTTYFRRTVTSNTVTVNSATATVTVNPLLAAVISPASQTVIPNAAAGLLTCTPAGGNGTFTYQWQISADNINFVNINTATGSSYSPDVLVSTMYFRAAVTSNGLTVNSNVATVTIAECVALGSSPSLNQNFIATSVPRTAMQTFDPATTGYSSCDVNQVIQYLDGLGRPLQTVQVKESPSNRDIVTPNSYDLAGREAVQYLPYVAKTTASDGSYKSTAITDQASFYNTPAGAAWNAPGVVQIPVANSITPSFAQTVFEASPLNRTVEHGASGATWQPTNGVSGHTDKIVYTTNDQVAFPATTSGNTGSRKVAYYTVNNTGVLTRGTPAFYDSGTLFVTISKDENWQNDCFGTVEEYKDKAGHVILKRTYNLKTVNSVSTAEMLSTYYVYDDQGNLTYVLPPLAAADLLNGVPASTIIDNLCYQYKYDGRNRMVQKKIPGKGWESMVYNKLDQLVLDQDAVQKASNQWTVTKYDAFGRVIMTGLWTDVSVQTPSALQLNIDNNALWDSRNASDVTTGYTISSYPGIGTYLSITYYDNYTFGNITGFPSPFATLPTGAISLPKGSATASKQFILGTANGLWSVTYYDGFGRVTQTYKQHNLGGGSPNTGNYDAITNSYDFTGALISSTRKHYVANSIAVTVANTYIYDHAGRKKQTYEQINSGVKVLLSQLTYNELGQLMTKKQGSEDLGGYFLQKSSYAYNERGWLYKLNDPAITPTAQAMFAMQLGYNSGPSPQYNGNISSQQWYTYQQPSAQTFNYTYDPLNRQTSGVSGLMAESAISYDQGGNIQSLKRDGNATYTYSYITNTNQLQSVSGLTAVNYVYDANSGNVTTDGRTGATLTYNLLNLPSTIVKTGTGAFNITYTYSATGEKLRKVSGTNTTDYISGIQYDNLSGANGIDFIQTDEGRAMKRTDGTYRYEYDLADHLGNTRVTFYKDPVTLMAVSLQADNYYPFGMRSSLAAGTNHYLYNKKELQDETSQYDYGARFYDPVIGRWTSVDPLADKYQSWSPYNYGLNNPIRIFDVGGMAPADIHITISDKPVGSTQIRVIGSESVKQPYGFTMSVPTYQMTITDDATDKVSTYTVTRDAPILNFGDKGSEGSYNVNNTAFEPKTSEGSYNGIMVNDYPKETGFPAIVLTNKDGSRGLAAEPMPGALRTKPDVAKGVSIHVGGNYTNLSGEGRTTGSEGCFTCVAGNKTINAVGADINQRLDANKKAGTGTNIDITVQKREDVKKKLTATGQ